MVKLLRLAVLVLGVAALLGWGLRELWPKVDESEAVRLREETDSLRTVALLQSQRADALLDTLDQTRAAFEADTSAHNVAIDAAIGEAHSVAERLRATQTDEQNARLDSVVNSFEAALAESEAKATSNAERLSQTEEALRVMTVSRDDWQKAFVKADSTANENWNLYQKQKRKDLFGLLNLQCTVGGGPFYGTKGADVGFGVTCGVGI